MKFATTFVALAGMASVAFAAKEHCDGRRAPVKHCDEIVKWIDPALRLIDEEDYGAGNCILKVRKSVFGSLVSLDRAVGIDVINSYEKIKKECADGKGVAGKAPMAADCLDCSVTVEWSDGPPEKTDWMYVEEV